MKKKADILKKIKGRRVEKRDREREEGEKREQCESRDEECGPSTCVCYGRMDGIDSAMGS